MRLALLRRASEKSTCAAISPAHSREQRGIVRVVEIRPHAAGDQIARDPARSSEARSHHGPKLRACRFYRREVAAGPTRVAAGVRQKDPTFGIRIAAGSSRSRPSSSEGSAQSDPPTCSPSR